MMREDYVMSSALTARRPRGLLSATLRMMLAAAALGAAIGLMPFGFSQAQAAEPTHLRVSSNAFGSTQSVSLNLNKSMIIDLPIDVQEVIVSQPAVANTILRSKRRAVLQAVGAGDTNIFFLDASGRTIVVLDVSTTGSNNAGGANVAAVLRDTYAKVMPNSDIQVESVALVDGQGNTTNRIVLSGNAGSADDAEKAVSIAAQFAGAADNVTSVINVAGAQQVMLKVTVAEVNRSLAKQFGIDLTGKFSSGGARTTPGCTQPPRGAAHLCSLDTPSLRPPPAGASLHSQDHPLAPRGRPPAPPPPPLSPPPLPRSACLPGGEFPVPTSITDGTVSVGYKEFGVSLNFTPTIKSNGSIGLVVDTTSSELSAEGSITVGSSTLPGIKKRTAKTSVEIGAGQTLAIGGLIEEKTRTQIHRLPGLGDIPILGSLFRSRDFIRSQSELVILVTPYLAKPTNKKPELPTDRMQFANDAEAIFLGHIETMYGVGPAGTRGSYDGSVGFLLD